MQFRSVLLAAVLAAVATPVFAREVVQFSGYPAGTIVVKTTSAGSISAPAKGTRSDIRSGSAGPA